MTTYRQGLPKRPARISDLPLDERGYPVPWFVAWIDGKPDFRVVKPGAIAEAHNKSLCWLCGKVLGAHKVFVVGPMCGVNRISSEPPSHLDCAKYAVTACPFLTRPLAVRNERGFEEMGAIEPAGIMIKRNPGVTLLWSTKDYRLMRQGHGVLFRIGEPTQIAFYAKGRLATRDEVDESVRTGLPLLEDMAQKDGSSAVRALNACKAEFQRRLEKAFPA